MGLIFHAPFLPAMGTGYKLDTIQNSFKSINELSNVTMPSTSGPLLGGYLNLNNGAKIEFTPVLNKNEITLTCWIKLPTTVPDVVAETDIIRIPMGSYGFSIVIKKESGSALMFGYRFENELSLSSVATSNYGKWVLVFLSFSSKKKKFAYDYIFTNTDGWLSFMSYSLPTYNNRNSMAEISEDKLTLEIGSGVNITVGIADLRVYNSLMSEFEWRELIKIPLLNYPFDVVGGGSCGRKPNYFIL